MSEQPSIPQDEELIDQARSRHRETFTELWEGNLTQFDSIEEADRRLCKMLAHEMRGEIRTREQLDRLFRQSNLFKLDESRWNRPDGSSTYGEKITEDVITEVEAFFDGENEPDSQDWISETVNAIEEYITRFQSANDGDVPTGRTIAARCAQEIAEHGQIIAVNDTETLWAYDVEAGIWKANGKQLLLQILDEALDALFTRHLFQEIRTKLRARLMIERGELGTSSGTIAVNNGLLDISTGDLCELEADDRAIRRLPIYYDPDAECPKFRDFIHDVCPEEDIPLLQEYLGYCLDHHSVIHKRALILFGPTDAGKSVLLDVLNAMFGEKNAAHVSPQGLANTQWEAAQLVDKLVNIRHDLDPDKIQKLGKIKEIIAGNPISAQRKYEQVFKFCPTAKNVFAANRAPMPKSDDQAFWNRWITIIFPEGIPQEEQDEKLTEKLTTEDELSGILNWALEGYQRLEEQGHFTNEPTPTENRRKWEAYGNSVDRFVHARLHVTGDNEDVHSKDLIYNFYVEFANKEGLEVETKTKFTQELTKRNNISKGYNRIDKDPTPCYRGIQPIELAKYS